MLRLATILLLLTLVHQASAEEDPFGDDGWHMVSNNDTETPIDPSVAEPGPDDTEAAGDSAPETEIEYVAAGSSDEIALEAAFAELVLPEQLESNCARVAGRTLQCFAQHRTNSHPCADLQHRHLSCIWNESPTDESGHKSLTRVKKGRHGYMMFNPFDIYFGISMELYGEWSELEWINMKTFIAVGDTVLDIGAHMGALTVPIAKQVGEYGRVHAFEPQRVLHQLATANVAINSLWNTVVHHAGVGTEIGTMTFETPYRTILRNFGGMPLLKGEDAEKAQQERGDDSNFRLETVPVVTVDSLNLTRCDFMKVDVEGMEEAVLAGAMRTIQQFTPTIYYEDNGYGGLVPPTRVYKSATVVTLVELGYSCYFDVQPYFNPDNFGKERENYFQFDTGNPQVSTMILCVHPARFETLPDHRFARVRFSEDE